MESSDEEPMDTGVQNGTQEDLDTSQSSLDETRAIYQEIRTDLVEATTLNATIASMGSTAESQLAQDMGQRILETSKKIPSIVGKEGKDDTEYVREESEGFMNAAAAISENLFQPKHGVIDSKASVLTDMMMNRIGKTNGDTMEKDDFYRLFQTFNAKTKVYKGFFPSGGTIEKTWDRTYPRGLSLSDYHALGKKLGFSLLTDQDFIRFNDEIMSWSEETFEANKEKISRKIRYGKGTGTEQDLEQNQDETTVNRDTAFQKNMLEIILESFETDVNEKHQSFDYWESVIGEEFSHTVENIFYMSFLMKEGIIVAWIDEYDQVVFAPNYEKLAKSKFGGKYNKGGSGKEKNKNRVRCKRDEKSVEAAEKLYNEADKTFQKLNEKNAKAEKIYREKQDKEFIGGYKRWSPQGVVSITPKEWREWKEYLEGGAKDEGTTWTPFFTAIHKAKKID